MRYLCLLVGELGMDDPMTAPLHDRLMTAIGA